MTTIVDLIAARAEPRVRAFLRALRLGEGTSGDDGYSVLVGGGHFSSFAAHPRVYNKALDSTAAGAYQIIWPTWSGLVKQYGFSDFSPRNQDLAAIALIIERKALQFILTDQIGLAVNACGPVWASLPSSTAGQRTVSMAAFLAEYNRWLKEFADAPSPAPATPKEVPPVSTTTDAVANAAVTAVSLSNPMAGALLQIGRSLWPELKGLFVSPDSSEVAKRNMKAAEAVVGAIMDATGTQSPGAAADVLQTGDAQMVQQARVAALGALDMFELSDSSGIVAARQWAAATATPPFYKTGAFAITLLLMPPIYWVVWVVTRDGSPFGADIRAAVVSALVTGALAIIMNFWMGQSFKRQQVPGNGS